MQLLEAIGKLKGNQQLDITSLAKGDYLNYNDEQLATKIIVSRPNKHQVLIETYENEQLNMSELHYLDDTKGIETTLKMFLG